MIDSFSEWHLRLIILLQDPDAFVAARGIDKGRIGHSSSMIRFLELAYPELAGQEELCDLIWKDVHRRGLTDQPDIRSMITHIGEPHKRTNAMGDLFVGFITKH